MDKSHNYIELNKFQPRDYQLPFLNAIEKKGYRRALLVWPRRAGKDMACWNLAIRAALRKPQVIWILYPSYAQGRKAIFDSITNDGVRFLDYIPEDLISSINHQEMKIRFKNNSLIQVVGCDNVDTLVGSNAKLMIFSEYSMTDPRAYKYLRPVLLGNQGIAIFISTPRGPNHFQKLFLTAQQDPEWFCERLTVEDTQHMDIAAIKDDIKKGIYSHEFAMQEYWCEFNQFQEGAFYGKALDRCRFNQQITNVPWDVAHKVWTAWDLGYSDSTAIIFFQFIGSAIHIIDCYQNNKESLEHYIHYVNSKPYIFGGHIAPFDIGVHEYSTGLTRYEQAQQLGVEFTIADKIPLFDGIEAVRATLSRCYIDRTRCADLLIALESYRQEKDEKGDTWKKMPLHDKHSHFSDAMRYLCISLSKVGEGMTEQDAADMYNRALSRGYPSTINDPTAPPIHGITGRMPY